MNKESASPQDLVDLQKHYAALYGRGVISVDEDCIHVTPEYFKEIFRNEGIIAEWTEKDLQLRITYNDVTFIALF